MSDAQFSSKPVVSIIPVVTMHNNQGTVTVRSVVDIFGPADHTVLVSY
jgi:hypothetical protein